MSESTRKSGEDLIKTSAGKILGEVSKLEKDLFMNKELPFLMYFRRNIKGFTSLDKLTTVDTRFLTIFTRLMLLLVGFHIKPRNILKPIQIKAKTSKEIEIIIRFSRIMLVMYCMHIQLDYLLKPAKENVVYCKVWEEIENEILAEGRWKDLQEMDNTIRLVAYLEREGLIRKDEVQRRSLLDKLKESKA